MKHLAALTASLLLTAFSAAKPAADNTIIHPTNGVLTVDTSNPYTEAIRLAFPGRARQL